MELCISCKVKPIQNKKRKLCLSCYQKLRITEDCSPKMITKSVFKKIIYKAEMEFIKNFFTNNNKWIYEPVNFKLGDCSYTPDFYDSNRNVFIEVVGTRQAYSENKEKYKKLVELFPKIKFEIRNEKGELIPKYNVFPASQG